MNEILLIEKDVVVLKPEGSLLVTDGFSSLVTSTIRFFFVTIFRGEGGPLRQLLRK